METFSNLPLMRNMIAMWAVLPRMISRMSFKRALIILHRVERGLRDEHEAAVVDPLRRGRAPVDIEMQLVQSASGGAPRVREMLVAIPSGPGALRGARAREGTR